MKNINNFDAWNVRELLEKFGEKRVRDTIETFSCPLNPEIENFLKKNAIDFTKKSQSVTYLVSPIDEFIIIGYFSIAIKPFVIGVNDIKSNTQRKKIERIAKLDDKIQSYTMAAYLIAQLGKNYYHNLNEKISGDELLDTALDTLKDIQYDVGGMVAFVETEERKKLVEFYNRNYFFSLENKKITDSNEFIQLFRLL
ncbi:MAG: GNAT family acetyltransferase [Synergistaceae bacterium]|nr:GNAT family acetyltransferase [Synergistaceae bacterium]